MSTRDHFGVNKAIYITLSRKPSNFIILLTVQRTNTRGQGEYAKASELTIVKELCKLIPYVRNKGCLFYISRVKSERGLFNKNTALC